MKNILLLSLFFFPIQINAAWGDLPDRPLHSKYIGQYFGQAGFGLGAASALCCVYDKYGAGFSLGCLSIGSFLLSPLVEEIFNPDYRINISNIYRFKKLLPCGLGGFACIAIGLKAMKKL